MKATEIAHYTLTQAGAIFADSLGEDATTKLSDTIGALFGHDLDVTYVDKEGSPVVPALVNEFTILVKDQYRAALQ